jgi:hypothetical protein
MAIDELQPAIGQFACIQRIEETKFLDRADQGIELCLRMGPPVPGRTLNRARFDATQGSAYSPTALNVRLHHAHDLGVQQGHYPPWFRYADNVVYIGQGVPEGQQALDQARHLLGQAGFTLKGTDGPPVDLRIGEKAQLLGFTLYRKNNVLQFGLGSNAWSKLDQSLLRTHTLVNPSGSFSAAGERSGLGRLLTMFEAYWRHRRGNGQFVSPNDFRRYRRGEQISVPYVREDQFGEWFEEVHVQPPLGEPERTLSPLTVEGMAAGAEKVFGERIE